MNGARGVGQGTERDRMSSPEFRRVALLSQRPFQSVRRGATPEQGKLVRPRRVL